VDALTRHRSRQVRDAVAVLAAAATRLAINVSQSARARRETHIGTWLPEPVDIEADLAHSTERAEALDRAVLVLLENLSPIERAAYVLREAFDYAYRQISKVLAISEANARQLAARARLHLGGERRRQVSAAQHQRFLACTCRTPRRSSTARAATRLILQGAAQAR
jgi:RNA polymerase sigma-70 factor (ECF subfamily)